MNRQQAERLMAALVFDDLDEASKAELLAYLQTDDELRERLADLRMAVKVTSDAVNAGPSPVLSEARLADLRRLAEADRKARVRLFTVRRVAAAAAIVMICAAILWICTPSNRVMHLAKARVDLDALGARMRTAQPTSARTESVPRPDAPSGPVVYSLGLGRGPAYNGPQDKPGGPASGEAKERVSFESSRSSTTDEAGGSYYARSNEEAPERTEEFLRRLQESFEDPLKGAELQAEVGAMTTSASENVTGQVWTRVPQGERALDAKEPVPQVMTEPPGRPSVAANQPAQGQAGSSELTWLRANGVSGPADGDGWGFQGGGAVGGAASARGGRGRMTGRGGRGGMGGMGMGSYGSGYGMGGMMGGMVDEQASDGLPEQGGPQASGRALDQMQRQADTRSTARRTGEQLSVMPPTPSISILTFGSEAAHEKDREPALSAPGRTDGAIVGQQNTVVNGIPTPQGGGPARGVVVDQVQRVSDSFGDRPESADTYPLWGDRPVAVRSVREESEVKMEQAAQEVPQGVLKEALSDVSGYKSKSLKLQAELKDPPHLVKIPVRSGALELNADSMELTKRLPAGSPEAEVRGGPALMGRPAQDLEADSTVLPTESRFKVVPVNPWVMTDRDPQSTFGLDVDTASYALCSRYIRDGFLPPAGAVRMEEFVNAFDYAYPQRDDPTFAVYAEGAPSPFAPQGRDVTLLKIAVKARTVGRDQRRPAHLVFVVDASASMGQPDRLPLVQSALGLLVDRLSEADRVSLVTCADEAALHLEAVSARDKGPIRQMLDGIQPAGRTNLLSGLKLGYAVARRAFIAGQVNQVVLCSDGVANVGQTEAQAVLQEVEADRRQGITLTCVGVGYGAYNDAFLEAMADRGDGRYVFLDPGPQAQEALVGHLADTLQTVAHDARIQVQFAPGRVRRYRLIGYENRDIEDRRFRDDTIDAGEVGSGQCSTALYELELVPRTQGGPDAGLGTVFVRYRHADTGRIEEVSRSLDSSIVRPRSVEGDPRFFLAAGSARFAEWLRQSEHARHTTLAEIQRVLDAVSAALPLDQDVQALARLARQAEGLPRAQ